MNPRFVNRDPGPDVRVNALKQAFQHEVRPADYMGWVLLTALVVAAFMSWQEIYAGGELHFLNLVPLDSWHAHDPRGLLYIETWMNIGTNAFQLGFFIWGTVLILLGVVRLVAKHRYVFACFFLGIGFVGIALALPRCILPLVQLAVERFPFLAN